MMKRVQAVKNEKGLTLIELLVVIVILGIIAAIAVVAIGGIIENSKKDNVVASAQQMISAAKLAAAGGDFDVVNNNNITLEKLQEGGYLDPFKGPNGLDPDLQKSNVTLVEKDGKITYNVTLVFKDEDNKYDKKYDITEKPEDEILAKGRGVFDE